MPGDGRKQSSEKRQRYFPEHLSVTAPVKRSILLFCQSAKPGHNLRHKLLANIG
jgi:hypothetical protein